MNGCSQFDSQIEKAYEADPFPLEIIALFRDSQRTCQKISVNECEIRREPLYYRDRLYVPNHDKLRLYLLQQHYDVPSAGHCGQAKTFEIIAREYTWLGMRKDVRQ